MNWEFAGNNRYKIDCMLSCYCQQELQISSDIDWMRNLTKFIFWLYILFCILQLFSRKISHISYILVMYSFFFPFTTSHYAFFCLLCSTKNIPHISSLTSIDLSKNLTKPVIQTFTSPWLFCSIPQNPLEHLSSPIRFSFIDFQQSIDSWYNKQGPQTNHLISHPDKSLPDISTLSSVLQTATQS